MKTIRKKTCPVCGKSFETDNKRIYCSTACSDEFQNRRHRKYRKQPDPTTDGCPLKRKCIWGVGLNTSVTLKSKNESFYCGLYTTTGIHSGRDGEHCTYFEPRSVRKNPIPKNKKRSENGSI